MELKVLILLSMLFGATLGQSISCVYRIMLVYGEDRYTCFLSLNNPQGRDDFTTIGGEHHEGRTNADVTAVLRDLANTNSPIFPQIICATFPNLVAVDFSFLNITELTENSFASCANIEWVYFFYNRIESVHERTFANNNRVVYVNFGSSRLSSLPENVFSNLRNLQHLYLSDNTLTIQPGLFRNLRNLQGLWITTNGITEINPQWFADLENLELLSFYNNNITTIDDTTFANLRNLKNLIMNFNPLESISNNAFRQLTNLEELYLAENGIEEINAQWFAGLSNLQFLYLYSNNIRTIQNGSFDSLTSLQLLDISNSHLREFAIPANAFNNLGNLIRLDLSYNVIQVLNPEWFRNLTNMSVLSLNFNPIQSLQNNIFAPFRELNELEMWGCELKTINRAAFGNIRNLTYVNFDSNVINAIDEIFLYDASQLDTLYLWDNLCTGERFYGFGENRDIFLPRLGLCTRNHRFIVETDTQGGAAYRFFPAAYPGLQLRVNTTSGVRIALTAFEVIHNPVTEIVLGANNNTLSQIVRNQDQVVVSVPTPNILNRGFPSGFRISWSQHIILVFREDQQFPFMAYTMADWYSIQFYALQSNDDATWYVQPIEAEIGPSKASEDNFFN